MKKKIIEKIRDNWKNGRIKNEIDNEKINKLIKNLIQIDINKRLDWEKYLNDDFFKKKIKKEYDSYGKLLFEGEYLNGERNGKGKEYDYYDGELIFEGEYLNGERKA